MVMSWANMVCIYFRGTDKLVSSGHSSKHGTGTNAGSQVTTGAANLVLVLRAFVQSTNNAHYSLSM